MYGLHPLPQGPIQTCSLVTPPLTGCRLDPRTDMTYNNTYVGSKNKSPKGTCQAERKTKQDVRQLTGDKHNLQTVNANYTILFTFCVHNIAIKTDVLPNTTTSFRLFYSWKPSWSSMINQVIFHQPEVHLPKNSTIVQKTRKYLDLELPFCLCKTTLIH